MLDKRNKRNKIRYDNVNVFLVKAKEVHGDTYDYSLVKEVKNISLKLPIICKVHGVFHQSPEKHIVRKRRMVKIKNVHLSKSIITYTKYYRLQFR